jgi:hypothetical protein
MAGSSPRTTCRHGSTRGARPAAVVRGKQYAEAREVPAFLRPALWQTRDVSHTAERHAFTTDRRAAAAAHGR